MIRSIQLAIENALNIDSNTSATIILTVSIFLVGLILNGIRIWFGQVLKRNNVRRHIVYILSQTSIDHLNQSKCFAKFISQLNLKGENPFHLKTGIMTHIATFKQLPVIDMYNSIFSPWFIFNKKLKIKAYNRMFKLMNHAEDINNSISIHLEALLKKFNQYVDDYNSNINSSRYMFDSLITETEGKMVESDIGEYLMELDQIYYNWHNQPNYRDYLTSKELFLNPVLLLNRRQKNVHFVNQMNNYILNALASIENMELLLSVYNQLFTSFYYSCRSIYRQTKLIAKILS